MQGKVVFVSGGAGVIGQQLVPKLINKGAKVVVGDLKRRPDVFSKDVLYIQGDLNNFSFEQLQTLKPDYFFHLAATFERSEETYEFWEENFYHNVRLSHYLVGLFKRLNNDVRIIFASSYLIYDQSLYQFNHPQNNPKKLNENSKISPRNLTGSAKYSHEIELEFFSNFSASKINFACVRIFRGYGKGSRDVISRWIRSLIKGKEIDVYRPEGMFDYIYSSDTAEGLLRIAISSFSGIVNLGSGKSNTVKEVVDCLGRYFPGMKINFKDSEISYEASQADMTKFYSLTKWLPEYSLDTSIKEIIEFERKRLNDKSKPKEQALKVLISSSSNKISLIKSAKDAAKRINPNSLIIAGDVSSKIMSKYIADEFWLMPKTSNNNLEDIIEGCILREINMVIPTRDGELEFWASNSTKFEEKGIQIITSSLDSISLCIDKLKFSEFGKKHNFPFIPSFESTKTLSDELNSIVVKERYGSGSDSLKICSDSLEAISHSKKLKVPIFQSFIPGREISVDAWLCNDGKVKGMIMRERNHIVKGESHITKSFRNTKIEKQIKKILEALKLNGPIVLQAIINEQNKINILECNPRFGGASSSSIALGLDSFYWSFIERLENTIDNYHFFRIDREIVKYKISDDLIRYIDDTNF